MNSPITKVLRGVKYNGKPFTSLRDNRYSIIGKIIFFILSIFSLYNGFLKPLAKGFREFKKSNSLSID